MIDGCRFIQRFDRGPKNICYWGGDDSQSAPAQTTQTTVQQSGPAAYLAPYLGDVATHAQSLYNTGQTGYYPGQTYAGQSGTSADAINRTIQRATAGSPLVPAAQGVNLATLQGQYLDPNSNPFARATVDAANRPLIDNYMTSVAPGNDSRFSLAGRYGSNAHVNAQTQAQDALQRGISENASSIYSGIYNTERGYQNQAVQQAPGLASADYTDIAALQGAGQAQEGYTQAGLNDARARYEGTQLAPWQNLARYAGIITGQNTGGTVTNTTTGASTQPMTGNSFLSNAAQGAQTATALAQLAKLFGAF